MKTMTIELVSVRRGMISLMRAASMVFAFPPYHRAYERTDGNSASSAPTVSRSNSLSQLSLTVNMLKSRWLMVDGLWHEQRPKSKLPIANGARSFNFPRHSREGGSPEHRPLGVGCLDSVFTGMTTAFRPSAPSFNSQ